MDFAANFTAIDFETASYRRDSACQLAAVRVRDGRIVQEFMWMIRPEPFSFSQSNIRVHGITPVQVRSEPTFGDLWDQISQAFSEDCLVAHNASFDIGVLRACLHKHQKPVPEINFSCTRAVAKRTWPHRSRFGLKPLSDWLGVQFRHHDALQDSIACAKIMIAAGIDKEAKSLEDLETKLQLSRGRANADSYRGPRTRKRTRARKDAQKPTTPAAQNRLPEPVNTGIDLQRLMVRADFIRPLEGKRVVFLGTLDHLERHDAEKLTLRSGGCCDSEISQQTDFVVVGRIKAAGDSVHASDQQNHEVARQLKEAGEPIEIINESGFLNLMVTHET